jgi:translation initiation factor 2 subunit 2
MNSYEELLAKAEKELPEVSANSDRFQIEKVKGHLEGNKTILINLKKIAKDLGREPDHLLKYLLRELASPGRYSGTRTIFGTKVSASLINKKIKKYVSEFVFCSECNKPDTTLGEEKGGIIYLKCQACGVKKPVKKL